MTRERHVKSREVAVGPPVRSICDHLVGQARKQLFGDLAATCEQDVRLTALWDTTPGVRTVNQFVAFHHRDAVVELR